MWWRISVWSWVLDQCKAGNLPWRYWATHHSRGTDRGWLSAHQGFCKGSLDYIASKVPVSHVISKVLETLGSSSEQVMYLEEVGFELGFGEWRGGEKKEKIFLAGSTAWARHLEGTCGGELKRSRLLLYQLTPWSWPHSIQCLEPHPCPL